jgi:hypothetical protein
VFFCFIHWYVVVFGCSACFCLVGPLRRWLFLPRSFFPPIISETLLRNQEVISVV